MARIALFDKNEPLIVETKEGTEAFCQCGLSEKHPYCDGSHLKTKDEDPDKLYQYAGDEKIVIGQKDEGDGCGCGHDHDDHDHGEDHECSQDDGEKKDGCCGGHCHD